MADLYDQFSKSLYRLGGGAYTGEIPVAEAIYTGPASPNVAQISPDQITSGPEIEQRQQFLGSVSVGKQGFTNLETGYILGIDSDDGKAKFYIGNTVNYLNWDGTQLIISGNISATTGSIGGFVIGADYIRDSGNTMGLASTVTGADDVRFWAGSSFLTRATAPFRVTESGVFTATSANISGSITATSGIIGGWIVQSGLLASAASGSRIELNQTKSRISIFDATQEVVVMGYLNGLPKNDGSGNWGVSDYGFWARAGNYLEVDGDAQYSSGDWIVQNDAAYLIQNAANQTIVRLGTDTGEKGLFIYDTTGIQLAKFVSNQIFVGNATESLKYTTASGLQISDPSIYDTLVAYDAVTIGDIVMILNNGQVSRANNEQDTIPRHYGIATNTAIAGASVKVQKTGIWVTSGLTPGTFYGAGAGYATDSATVTQATTGSLYDAALGVGQTITKTKLFTNRLALILQSVTGTSTPYTIRWYPVLPSEGGPARNALYDIAISVASITRVGAVVTVTMSGASTLFPVIGWYVLISGATQPDYNGWKKITSVSVTGAGAVFTYAIATTPATPATGTITAKFKPFYKTTTGAVPFVNTLQSTWIFTISAPKIWENPNELVMFEFSTPTAGIMNIAYSASSVYAGGNLWLTGISDATKDLGFTLYEMFGDGSTAALADTYSTSVGSFGTGFPTVVNSAGTFEGKYAASSAIGLAKTSTALLLGNYSRE